MKIGILTYHRSQNYGAQLQAYALQKYLTIQGNNVEFIDYWPQYHKNLYKTSFLDKEKCYNLKFAQKIKYLIDALYLTIIAKIRRYKTNRFAKKYLCISPYDDGVSFDIVVYGSDQIWRKQHVDTCQSYNPIYFGNRQINAKKKLAYAVSMGKIEADNDYDINFLKNHLSNFTNISVRELDLQFFLSQKLNIEADLVCDPVFLLKKEEWPQFRATNAKNDYIFVYNIAGVEKINRIAERLATTYNTNIVEYCGYVKKHKISNRNKYTGDAMDFLQMLVNAKFVVTSSFHGVALSVCFEKQFYFASTDYLKNRTVSLLSKLKLTDFDYSQVPIEDIDCLNFIDYTYVNVIKDEYIQESKSWIQQNITM